jgi:membrane protease subunit HflK
MSAQEPYRESQVDWKQKYRAMKRPIRIWVIAILAIWILSGIFFVKPGCQGVVRRFGKKVRIVGPGPHYRIPWPMERADRVSIEEVRRLEVGFRTVHPGPPARYRLYPQEALMLTGDENIVDCQIIVQYRVSDVSDYLFNVRDQVGTLKDAAEVALRHVIGYTNIDDALTVGKARIQNEAMKFLQRLIDRYRSGLLVTAVKLQDVRPPQAVDAAFKDVVSAKEDRDRLIQEAKGYYEDVIPKARGEAEKKIKEAEAYSSQRIKRAQGNAAKFLTVLKEYKKAEDVTRKRLYLETMEEILPGIRKFVIDSKSGGSLLQLLPLEERKEGK